MRKTNGLYRRDILSAYSKYFLVLIFIFSLGTIEEREANAQVLVEGPCVGLECVENPTIPIQPPIQPPIIDPGDPINPGGPGDDDGGDPPRPGVGLCNTGNPCTTSSLNLGGTCPALCTDVGCCPLGCSAPVNVINGTECTTVQGQGTCQNGVCDIGGPIACSPGQPCVVDGQQGICQIGGICLVVGDPTPIICDDGLFCTQDLRNLDGSCTHPPKPIVDDGIPCTVDACDEDTDSFTHTPNNAACDNGLFCDGEEICDMSQGCIDGPDPTSDDGISCTVETCNEEFDDFVTAADSSLCDDGLFCNGIEQCSPSNGDPVTGCAPGLINAPNDLFTCTDRRCDEEIDQYVFDPNDSKCDDGDMCNGIETCDPNNAIDGTGCVAGTEVEIPEDGPECIVRACDPATGLIFDTLDSTLCEPDDECKGVKRCVPDDPIAGADGCIPTEIPDTGSPCDDGEGVCSPEMMCVESTGTIKIVKMADPNDGEDFLFLCSDDSDNELCSAIDLDGDGNSAFTLDDEEVDADGVPNMMTFAGIPSGIYRISEAVQPGWGLIDIVCEGDLDEESGIDNSEVIIDLDPFENITCTFFNELLCGNGVLDNDEECDPGINPDFCSDVCFLFDTDNDGIPDEFDLCPEIAPVVDVDGDGCPDEEMTCDCDDPNAITRGFPTGRGTYFFGTFGDDIICGTSERDVIFAFSGNDCIDAGAGNDVIFAGFGDDIADGGEGRDFVHGGFGIDMCFGERLRRCE